MTSQAPILVTGANKRGGLEICRALHAQGISIIGVYRSMPGELLEIPGATLLQADLCDPQSRERLIESVNERFDSLRGIIHNASLWLDDSLVNLERMLQIHVAAPYQLNERLQGLLRRSSRADIIHIGDDTAVHGTKNHVAYAASKAALLNLMLSFAEKFAPAIRVNAISPGLLKLKEGSDMDYREKTLRKALLEVEPGNAPLVDAVLYLLGSHYHTGNNIIINGGRHLKRQNA